MADESLASDMYSAALRGMIATLPKGVQRRVDSWANGLSSLGTMADKVMHTAPTQFCALNDAALAAMFHSDHLVRKAVGKRPSTALAKGVGINVPEQAGGPKASTRVQDALDELCAVERFTEAAVWENLFGGAVIWAGIDDGQRGEESQAQPIRLDSFRKVLWLKALDRRYVRPSERTDDVITNPADPNFGEPSHYVVDAYGTGGSVLRARIHRDRLIIFPGALTTVEERQRRNGWGCSVLDAVYDVIQRHVTAWQSAGNAVANSQYVVMKLKGLSSMLGTSDGESKMKARSKAIEMAKSLINAVLMDSEDSYERGKADFGNLPEMLDRFMMDVAGALDMPVTELFGRSSAGLNATGEGDRMSWHGSVEEYRATKLRPRLEQFVRLLMLSKDGPTKGKELSGWRVVFPPLEMLSSLQEADRYLKTAQADAHYIDSQVLLPGEVALSRFPAEGWSAHTTIDLDARKLLADAEVDALEGRIKSQGE